MKDKIIITGLRVFGYHGVNRIERERGQDFVVDIESYLDLRPAGTSDLLGRTLDYDSLIKDIQRVVGMERYTLIEALAERIAEVTLERDDVRSVVVRVSKPSPPVEAHVENIQVEITRSR